MNHTPTTSLPNGKTPKQLLLEHMKVVNTIPNLSTLRTFGEPGYVHTAEQRRHKGSKFEPRAEKHYFVGRQGSRIYLMWNPRTERVTRTSSVTWATHPLTEGSAYIDLPGPTQASDAKPPDGLYNTSTGSNPPSLLHPTPPGGSTHMGAPPGGSTHPMLLPGGGGGRQERLLLAVRKRQRRRRRRRRRPRARGSPRGSLVRHQPSTSTRAI